jgi:hypothetical protein
MPLGTVMDEMDALLKSRLFASTMAVASLPTRTNLRGNNRSGLFGPATIHLSPLYDESLRVLPGPGADKGRSLVRPPLRVTYAPDQPLPRTWALFAFALNSWDTSRDFVQQGTTL